MESFAQAFSKACRSRRDRRSPSAEGETPLSFESATEGVNFRQRRKEGEPHKWGVPLSTQAIYNCLSAFFFGSRGANENSLRCAQLQLASRFALSKKEHADKEISPRARGDQRSARWMGGRFLKKATEKLSTGFAAKSSLNLNLTPKKGEGFPSPFKIQLFNQIVCTPLAASAFLSTPYFWFFLYSKNLSATCSKSA